MSTDRSPSFEEMRRKDLLPPGVTIISCGDPGFRFGDAQGLEAQWLASEVQRLQEEQEREWVEQEQALDLEARLAGPCDLCRTEDHNGLRMDGGHALCEDCCSVAEGA